MMINEVEKIKVELPEEYLNIDISKLLPIDKAILSIEIKKASAINSLKEMEEETYAYDLLQSIIDEYNDMLEIIREHKSDYASNIMDKYNIYDYVPRYEFEVKELDDGKEKYQSHEYCINGLENASGLYIHGYGADKEEAKYNCLRDLDLFIKNISDFRNKLI